MNKINYDLEISGLLKSAPLAPFIQRVDFFSQAFLNRPYLMDALGEGTEGEFDQNPLYRTDYFDCLTYVNTVLALAISKNLESFQKNIIKINYRHALPTYENRHHFMSIDWNPENEKHGIIEEITNKIGIPVQNAEAIIDRGGFFRHKTSSAIRMDQAITPEKKAELLERLHERGDQFKPEKSRIKYISLEDLFQASSLLQQNLPEFTISEIIRPNWDLREKIGTHLNISHLGFVINRNNKLSFRHATIIQGKVVEVDFFEYLEAFKNHPTLKGVNFFRLHFP